MYQQKRSGEPDSVREESFLKGVRKAQKNIEKVLDKKYDLWYNDWAVREESKQDLENWTILKLVEP